MELVSKQRMRRIETPVGKRFGRLTVIAEAGTFHVGLKRVARRFWLCRCDCGNERNYQMQSIRNGDSKSCGCLCREINIAKLTGAPSRGRKAPGIANRNMVLMYYRNRARRAGREFDITPDEFFFFTKQPCYYCGAPPSNRMNWKGCFGTYVYSGIDRVDNSIGYVVSNCVACCGVCNRAKGARSQEEFIEHVKRIYRCTMARRKLVARDALFEVSSG